MSAAVYAKSASARATIAAGLLKSAKPWPRGHGLGRNFDDCFEMGDGDAVLAALIERAANDPQLVKAMETHGQAHWVAMIHAPRHTHAENSEHRALMCIDGELFA